MRWRTEQQTSLFNEPTHAVETALELWFGLPLASLVVPLQLSISADGLSRQDPYLERIEQTRQASPDGEAFYWLPIGHQTEPDRSACPSSSVNQPALDRLSCFRRGP